MSGKRVSLSGLAGIAPAANAPAKPVEQRPTQTAPAAPQVAAQAPAAARKPTTPRKAPEAPMAPQAAAPAPSVRTAKWQDFERKDTRIREDQLTYLEDTRKRLNRSRGGAGERLTDNTLVRLAIDLLRDRDADLAGATEDELRRSLGLTS